ncbi:autotransporter-associated N-terminal domain-containing protein [Fusobacterium pseudoperiodonticum]|uniref:autotransporter-associated N-terminal domain-containing protein n=1 Tax=Fusobacterium pseudoperiodonticum TaxID=2663009 RepID=UPI000C1B80AD|nr:autotransporter-associated N-terminal domain-containing protein [Fusobacterium pseudoperiodonticum]ATV57234.1 autotransporter domain-containing protein [Fusobacterium pseudoperiodonticum]
MTNNSLQTTEKNLRSIAKRYENVKYSVGLAVLFLMKGTSAFSEDNKIQEIEKQKDILTDAKKEKAEVKETKKKEKATQKLKASWANVQFGANDLYSNFFVTPKTKVDKVSIVKSENTILLASADNNTSLPTFSKIASDIEETYAPTTEEINTSKGNLRNSIGNLQEKINNARAENAKEVQGLKLELVQLMEQGDQVVKSPWSSWQFGANYMYNNWNGAYKGRGDKVSEGAIINKSANSLDPLAKNIAIPNLKSTRYGSTDLNIVEEPNASVSVTTRIAPVIIDKTTTRKNQEPYVFKLPYFEAREIGTPSIPTINAPNITVSGFADFPGRWINGVAGRYSYWHTNNGIGNTDGNLYQTSVEKGEVLKRRGGTVNRIQLKNYQRGQIQVRPVNVDVGVEPPENIDLAGDVPTFFMSLEDIPYSYFGKDSKLSLINENNNIDGQIFIHFETEGNTTDKFDKLKADGHISTEEFNEIRKYTDDTDFKNDQGGELYHVNRGTVELGGTGIRYVQTTFAGNMGRRVNLVENRGNIISMNYEEGNTKTHSNAIFLYGPDTGSGYTGTQHIYANNKTGKISMYGEKGYLAVFTASSTLARGDVSFINDGEANLYGRNSVGLFITKDARGKLSQKSNFIMNSPINLQGDNTTGLYIENSGDGIKNDRNTARFVIGAKDNATIPAYVPENSLLNATNSKEANHNKVGGDENLAEEIVGIYLNNPIAELHVKVPQLEIEKFAKKSIGIFSKDGEVKATDGNIELKGGEDNIALYANGGKIDYTGNINVNKSTLAGDKGNANGIGNMAVFASSPNNYVKVNGDINMDTRDTVAIYSDNTKVDLNGKLDIKLKPESTGKNIAIYAKNSSVTSPVTVQTNQSKIEIDGKKDDGTITNQGLALYAEQGGQIVANGTSLTDGLYMKVTNGGSAIVSDGATSNVQAKYSTIDYDGNGYALYTKNNGNIDVRNAKINLYGKSTGFERSGVLSDPFTINLANSKFYAHSNDISIMSLKNIPSLNFSTLAGTFFSGYLGGAEVHGASGAKNYKIATIDGIGAFNIDSDYDKSRALDPTNEGTNDYVLTRHLLMQRAKINLKSGNNVRAILSSSDIADLGEQTAVGLANYVGDEINLETNTSVNVDRTDKASGAVSVGSVGLFADGGRVNVASGATINVEKENNFVNGSSVGIYASNGAAVSNAGTVNVGGKGSIGILSMTRRIDPDGNPLPGGSTLSFRNESTGVINMDGESAIGVYFLNNHSYTSNPVNRGHNFGVINMSGNNAIGMLSTGGQVYNMNTININSDQGGVGIYATAGTATNPHFSDIGSDIGAVINLKSSVSKDNPNIGIFTEISKDGYGSNLSNSGDIIGGDNNYGIYGVYIWHDTGKIKLGNDSVGIFGVATIPDYPSDISITDGEIEVGNNSKGIFVSGNSATNLINGAKMTIGDNSFAYVLDTKEIPADPVTGNPAVQSVLESNSTDETKLGNNSIFIYSSDKTAIITNNTPLRTTGNKNYGIYASGNITNLADMDFSSGVGNVGILNVRDIGNTTSKAVNGQLGAATQPTITVGKSDVINENYSIGMAAGYLDKDGVLKQTGHVENYGKIDVVGEGGIGMYAAGSGSMAINHVGAEINLSGQDSIGMYLTDSAIGENYGTIRTAPNNTKDGIVGVVANNNAVIKNYGTIEIKGEGNTGILLANGGDNEGNDPVNLDGAEGVVRKRIEPTGKKINGVEIVAPGNGTATIKRNGKPVVPTLVDTIPAKPNEITAGATTLDLRNTILAEAPSLTRASSLGMYVDTSGRQFTNPIQGLEHLTNLKEVNLIFGIEATNYTDSKDIQVGENILSPYNNTISTLSRNGKTKFNLNSGSLTWIATGTQDTNTGKFNAVYLSKIPYTSFAKDKDTYNFMDGLEQRYGVEGTDSREKTLFNKLNQIGKGEPELFAQAVDEMKGHQYANTQQRVQATGDILNKEFNYLRNEWQNVSKSSNKIKTFGTRGEYNTKTAGIKDYKSNAHGVAYVHEDETVRLGESVGWYAGIVHNKLKFKDLGNSKEEMLQGKLGVFKSVPFDENNSLNWTISGDISVGHNKMHRRYLVVDEVFNAKSRYSTYGVGIKNELSKEFRLSEDFTFKPYVALGLEYGRISKIKEKSGEMKLEVKANDYLSVRPEIGSELAYKHYFGAGAFKATVGVAYENELGRVANAHNKAKVSNTSADWYDLRGEKEDRTGNVKTDLNIGWDNQKVGVTASIGYDTKGHNVRGGVGLRVIF